MSEKKELNNEQLNKVSGGYIVGDSRIVECENCKTQFNPDTAQRGPDATDKLENGEYGYATYKCPSCNEYHRVKVIQVKKEDIQIPSMLNKMAWF